MTEAGLVSATSRPWAWVPYVVPFAVFMLLLAVVPLLGLSPRADAIVRVAGSVAAILLVARPVLDFRLVRPLATAFVGVGVFALWIAPDLLIPGYRAGWLFQNDIVGRVHSSLAPDARTDPLVVGLRFTRAALIVPIVEELFWRGWLPRWIDRPDDFQKARLGTFTRWSFWATAVLFALEHGSYWDVGLVAGLVYNGWMRQTRSLGDLMLAHAVTNACLGCFVVLSGRWEYW